MEYLKKYEKIFPETNWSDVEIISKMYMPKKQKLNKTEEKDGNPIKLNITIDEFVKQNHGIYLEVLYKEIGIATL